jgi:uncharacterized protein YaeQ
MSARHVFNLRSADPRRVLPVKILLVQDATETFTHILLKILAFLMFQRERLLIEPSLDDDHLPFRPDVAQLDYEGRITLWIECGECLVEKLDRLAVKAPYGEIWAVKKSPDEAEELLRKMARGGLRKGRYGGGGAGSRDVGGTHRVGRAAQ